jgi:hypothetical protein
MTDQAAYSGTRLLVSTIDLPRDLTDCLLTWKKYGAREGALLTILWFCETTTYCRLA